MLEIRGIAKTYQSNARSIEAIRDLSLSVSDGEFLCVVGPSGCGKTTLLRVIGGLLQPTAGQILVDGEAVSGPPPGMAIVFQEYGRSLFPWMSVSENVELPLKQKGLGRKERADLVTSSLDAVGLGKFSDAYPWQLSGGMQQRVAIARALAYQPAVLLMDEPFAAVDAQTKGELEDLVRQLWSRLNVTVLFVTHDIDEAVYLAQRVVVLTRAPTLVKREFHIDLPDERDQLSTRALPRFAELRSLVYSEIHN